MSDLAALKAAAPPFMRELIERAGFRPSRIRNKYHCNLHPDSHPSCHLYDWGLKRFCCGDSLPVIDLAALAVDGSIADGIRELERLTGVGARTGSRADAWPSSGEFVESEMWRVGWMWALERKLAELKSVIPWEQEAEINDDGMIQAMTEALATALSWAPRQLSDGRWWQPRAVVDARRQMDIDEPVLVAACIAEAREAMMQLANIISRISSEKEAA